MILITLVVLFVAVFGFIAWRIFAGHRLNSQAPPPPPVTYECPICNEVECDCHKTNTPEQ